MHTLAIISGSLARSGAERVSKYLAEQIYAQGIETVLITLYKAKEEYGLSPSIKRITINGSNALKTIQGIRKSVIESKADTVLVMGVSNTIFAIPALVGLDIKVVVSERNSPANFDGKRITKIVSRLLLKHADGYVFQTEEAKQFYKRMLNGRGMVIPNPLFNDGLPEAYTGKREKRIVTVGRLVNQKNQEMLIDAFYLFNKEMNEYILEIYGEGENRNRLEDKIKNLGLQKCVFLMGNVDDVLNRISKASLFVLPSRFEGMPNALIEALAIGVPCISTDCPCGGPGELIQDGWNGILIPVNDVEALHEAMVSLLSDDEKLARFSNNGVLIRDKLDSNVVLKDWISYLSSI